MTTAALERLRIALEPLIEAAAAEVEAERHAQASQAAAAMEAATGTAAIAAAYEQGRRDERMRVLAIVEQQRADLGRGGVNAISLATLNRAIGDV